MGMVSNESGTGATAKPAGHWQEMARLWQQIGPPLRPAPQDVGFFTAAVQEWIGQWGRPRVLLLGVTPEIYRLPWPAGTDILAVDRAQAMIDAVWPGPREAVQCTDWLSLQAADSSRDIVLCDGGLHLLNYPEEQQRLVGLLGRVLSEHGIFILRLFVPPAERERPEVVLADLLAGRISSLNVLKLRLGMALLESAAQGVELGTVWQTVHEVAPDLAALAQQIGWPVEHTLALNAYRGRESRYHFVTVEQVIEMFCHAPGGFEVLRLENPTYELGERCPTLILRRAGARLGS